MTEEIFARAEIPSIDVTAALESQPDQSALYFRYDGHFTPQGAEVVARAIGKFLTENAGLIRREK